MAVRNFLHKTQLDKFKAWLIKNNWTIVDTKGEYEVLRAKKKKILIIYKTKSNEHYSIRDKDLFIIKEFIKEDRRKENNI